MLAMVVFRPGGTAKPGGGPLAVEKGAKPKPLTPGMGPADESGVGVPIPPG